jgi:hypothetical protein
MFVVNTVCPWALFPGTPVYDRVPPGTGVLDVCPEASVVRVRDVANACPDERATAIARLNRVANFFMEGILKQMKRTDNPPYCRGALAEVATR